MQRWLTEQQRIASTAAVSLGLLAAYQAVINDDGDADVLDMLATKTLEAFPTKAEVSLDDAKGYVKNLKGNVKHAKTQYEAMMRKVHGDARYESQFKGTIDGMFRQAEQAESQKSVTEMAADVSKKYEEDRAKCYKGEEISPGSMVSPPHVQEAQADGGVRSAHARRGRCGSRRDGGG